MIWLITLPHVCALCLVLFASTLKSKLPEKSKKFKVNPKLSTKIECCVMNKRIDIISTLLVQFNKITFFNTPIPHLQTVGENYTF